MSACGSDEPAETGPVVMVLDDGFDVSEPHVRRALATFTVVCDQVNPPPIEPGDDLATRRAKTLEAFRTGGEACRLQEGLPEVPALFEDVKRLKDDWNRTVSDDALFSDRIPRDDFDALTMAFDRDLASKPFHGTATSGVIASGNPRARMVLVELALGTSEEVEANFECIQQADVDRDTELWNDEAFRGAFAALPVPRVDRELRALVEKHEIKVVNESFGQIPAPALEKLQREQACPPIDLSKVFEARAKADAEWEALHPAPDVLVVKAAGNEGVQIDDGADSLDCRGGEQKLMVGSSQEGTVRSEFSNFGDCVDVFARGQDIVAPVPGGWLMPLAGTSFSAPLLARWLILNAESSQTPAQLRQTLLGMRDPQKNLPLSMSPPELVYAPQRRAAELRPLPGLRAIPKPNFREFDLGMNAKGPGRFGGWAPGLRAPFQ